jgi:hypothetical protein
MGVDRRTPQMQQAFADARARRQARWNAAPTHDWSPSIGTVVTAGYRWQRSDERATVHSITTSARVGSNGGRSRPSALGATIEITGEDEEAAN